VGLQIAVEILQFEAGAREAAQRRSVTIVVDALRASATATTALHAGASAVLPVLSVEVAETYCGQSGYRVAGERHGIMCDGFDFGNSPNELLDRRAEMAGQTLVLSTSNGTRVLNAAAQGAAALFMGTTVNARAVARAAYQQAVIQGNDIVIIAAGEYDHYAEEDMVGARCIAAHLAALGAKVPADYIRDESATEIFRDTPSAEELVALGYGSDIDFCAQRDIFDEVPVLYEGRLIPYEVTLSVQV
jgi:2-phosphosulfolactate phosphatase